MNVSRDRSIRILRLALPFLLALPAISLLAMLASPARADELMRIVVPFGPGAVQDTVTRTFSVELGKALGRNVLVENRPGAGGTIGTGSVARSAPDGRTLILAAASHNLAASLYSKLPYDPGRDFVAVSAVGIVDYAIAAPSNVDAKDLRDYVQKVAASNGSMNYGSAGNGSATHLGMAYFLSRAKLPMQHVPMKSTGDAVNEVLAGRLQGVMSATIGVLGFKDDPRVRLLATTGTKRSSFLPQFPTVAESGVDGLKDFSFDSWIGLLGPKGMAEAEVRRIDAAMREVMKLPEVQERLKRIGVELLNEDAAAFAKRLEADRQKAARIVKESGARID